MRLPFGLTGPDAFRVSEIRDDRRQPLPKPKTTGPGLNEWMLETYGDSGFNARARELRKINQDRHDAARMNRPTRSS